jgi:seryl-tRNA synthetase
MPIDLDLLRNPETFEQVLSWQALRYPNEDRRSLLGGIRQADDRIRETRRELNASRNELKGMQQSLAPQHAMIQNVSVSTRQNEVRMIKARIRIMESAVDALQQEITVNMTRVANSIDVDLPPLLMVREDGDCAHHGTTKAAIMDPLFFASRATNAYASTTTR